MSKLHAHRPSDQRYVAQVRYYGLRTWYKLGTYRSFGSAATRAVRALCTTRGLKRARVLLVADHYEPELVFEASRP